MIEESLLTKGQLRKLVALRKSLGATIADQAFTKWLTQSVKATEPDRNEQVIADTLWGLIQEGRLSIQRGGYIVRRGHGRVIVKAA